MLFLYHNLLLIETLCINCKKKTSPTGPTYLSYKRNSRKKVLSKKGNAPTLFVSFYSWHSSPPSSLSSYTRWSQETLRRLSVSTTLPDWSVMNSQDSTVLFSINLVGYFPIPGSVKDAMWREIVLFLWKPWRPWAVGVPGRRRTPSTNDKWFS